jgi:hypothetical protein
MESKESVDPERIETLRHIAGRGINPLPDMPLAGMFSLTVAPEIEVLVLGRFERRDAR